MTVKYHPNLIQGSEEWFKARTGLLTASEMKLIVTEKTLKAAANEKAASHLYELAAQRLTGYVEPHYISDDMLRGKDDENEAKFKYEENYGRITDMGFITNDKFGFTLGYSPDGLVGDDGLVEVKSRRQKFQIQTIAEGKMPDEYQIQAQTGLLVSERKWCDFISYCGGLPMFTLRVEPDKKIQDAIIEASTQFHEKMDKLLKDYADRLADTTARLVATERSKESEMYI